MREYARAAEAAGQIEVAEVSLRWADTMDEWRGARGGGKLPDL